MIITMSLYKEVGSVSIQREPGEKGCYGRGWGAEHLLLYRLKQRLNPLGFRLIKKRMQKDGHLWGDEATPYLRSSNKSMKFPHIFIHDTQYAARSSAEDFNKKRMVELTIQGDIWELQPEWASMCQKLCQEGGIPCELQ